VTGSPLYDMTIPGFQFHKLVADVHTIIYSETYEVRQVRMNRPSYGADSG
jgi:hypothetical protein